MSGRLRRRYHRLLFTYPPAYRFEAALPCWLGWPRSRRPLGGWSATG
jgi:hypothetical protein